MEVGIKLWSSNPDKYVEEAGFADFVEVLPVDMEGIERLARKKYAYTVHVPHEVFDFSPMLNYKKSQELLKLTLEAAKKLKASWMIMHTGYLNQPPDEETEARSITAVAKLAREANYPKLILENSVVKEDYKGRKRNYIFYSYEQIKQMMEESGAGFCLDLEHAAIAAYQLGVEYEAYVAKLMKLKPDYFHLSGTKPHMYGPYGHHLSIFEGNIDLEFVKRLLKKAGKPVCLETPIDIEQRKKEVRFLKE